MTRSFALLLATLILPLAANPVTAAPTRSLDAELENLLKTVTDALEKDVALKGRTLSLGQIGSKHRPDSNYAPELRRLFESRLKGKLIPAGALTLLVTYDLFDSDKNEIVVGGPPGSKMKVLKIRVRIESDNEMELLNKAYEIEINESADIARVMGLTIAPLPNGDQFKRNMSVVDAANQNKGKPADQVKPTFQVRENTQIGIPGNDRFFVEILVKDSPDGEAKPIAPIANALGNAFVDIKGNQFYEVRVYNNDEYSCIANVRIDGQDAFNRFNVDGEKYNGLWIGKGESGTLRGWMHTTKPRPKEKDNVFAFAVREYGSNSPEAQKATGEFGVITVQFAVAWKKGDPRPAGRNIGRVTDKGPGLGFDFQAEKPEIGEYNETISIRYSPTAK